MSAETYEEPDSGVRGLTQWVMCRITLLVIFLALLTMEPTTTSSAAPAGDAKRGEQLFATSPCVSCHDVTKPWPGGEICPNLGNIATEAERIVRSREYRGKAKTAADYIRESIVDPNAYIVPGARYRTADGQSVMPKDFGSTLSGAQIDDLVAYLSTRR